MGQLTVEEILSLNYVFQSLADKLLCWDTVALWEDLLNGRLISKKCQLVESSTETSLAKFTANLLECFEKNSTIRSVLLTFPCVSSLIIGY